MALSTLFISRSGLISELEVRSVFNRMFDGVLVEQVDIEKESHTTCSIVVKMFQDRPATTQAEQFYNELAKTKKLQVYYEPGLAWTVTALSGQTQDKFEFKSLCIPRAHSSTTEWAIRRVFNALFYDNVVDRVEFKSRFDAKGESYYIVFVHFLQDRRPSSSAELFYADIQTKETIKVFNGNRDHFWKVVLNKAKPIEKPEEKPIEMPIEKPAEPVEPQPFKSLCIPRAMSHTTKEDVIKVFAALFDGDFIDRVDMKEKTDAKGEMFQTIFIHFHDRTPTNASSRFYAELDAKDANKEPVKVLTGVRNYFWKVVPNKAAVRVGPPKITLEDEQAFDAWRKANEAFEANRGPDYKEAVAEAEEFRKSKEGTAAEGEWWNNESQTDNIVDKMDQMVEALSEVSLS
jgi:hypothetical protein